MDIHRIREIFRQNNGWDLDGLDDHEIAAIVRAADEERQEREAQDPLRWIR